jgi:hypothetical protein
MKAQKMLLNIFLLVAYAYMGFMFWNSPTARNTASGALYHASNFIRYK